ncbi:hypothetical protein QEN19_001472 [Hanseniaspora menglaensis]
MSSKNLGISQFFKSKNGSNKSSPTKKEDIIMLSDSSDGEGEDIILSSNTSKAPTEISNVGCPSFNKQEAVGKDNTVDELVCEKKSYTNIQDLLNDIPSVDLDNVTTKVVDVKSFFKGETQADLSAAGTVDEDSFADGATDCLLGLTIVFTGVLPTLERGVAEQIAKKYGAKVTKSISGKTSVVVLGDEAGPSKVSKIKQLKTKCITEEGFRQLINGSPETGGSSIDAKKAFEKRLKDEKLMEAQIKSQIEQQNKDELLNGNKKINSGELRSDKQHSSEYRLKTNDSLKLWTQKYAPKSLAEVCGNKTLVARLQTWLSNWDTNYKLGFKSPGKDGNGIYRAAMLSGPPGIGKTTAAHLVAKSLGFEVVEKNASDVRSKSQLNEKVKALLGGTSVNSYFEYTAEELKQNKNLKKFVLIMDEVDGMSGGDRGGVGALTAFIRKTQTPIILICNERRIPKMRPFDRICLELPFRRPDAKSVIPRLMSIAYKEKFKLEPAAIEQLVAVSGGDIRLMINILNVSSKTDNQGITRNNISSLASSAEKDVSVKIFDVTSQLLSGAFYGSIGSARFPLWKKMELYFSEYQFCSLMIQENYITTRPSQIPAGKSHLQLLSQASDDISLGDVVDKNIRSGEQLWGLMPAHSIISSILPASRIAGAPSRINFASWLGQNSTKGKFVRLLQDLFYHSKICTSGTKTDFRTEYIPTLKQVLLLPILANGTSSILNVIETLDSYYLSKDDWDTIMTFLIGPQDTTADLKKIPTAVKSAFTRQYNSMKHPVSSYHIATAVTSGGALTEKADLEEAIDQEEVEPKEDEDYDENNDDIATTLKKDKLLSLAKPRKRTAGGAASKKTVKKRKL